MKYISPKEGVTLGIPSDTAEWNTFTKESIVDNKVSYYLGKGTYDGDKKEIILMENKLNWKIYVICDIIVPHAIEPCYALYMSSVGQGVKLIWSDKFKSWYVSVSGADCITKDEFEVFLAENERV